MEMQKLRLLVISCNIYNIYQQFRGCRLSRDLLNFQIFVTTSLISSPVRSLQAAPNLAAFGTFLQIHLPIEQDRWKWASHHHVTNISGKILLQRIFCAICKDIFLRIILLHVDQL